MSLLIVFSGLPGVGKTTLARPLAQHLQALYLRVDSIEAALKQSSLRIHPAEDTGYLASIAVTRDNLANGLNVVADAVNPIAVTRKWWAEAAADHGATLRNVELLCSDHAEHRRRVEGRSSDLDGLEFPDWNHVQNRHYECWEQDRLVIETSGRLPEVCLNEIINALPPTTRSA